jgi:hypothetical protein
MGKNDYIPSNPLAFQTLVHNVRAQVTVNLSRWNIPQGVASALDPLIQDFDSALSVSENPETRTSASIRKRDRTRAELEKVFRPFVQGQLENNRSVTPDDLTAMGLPVHDHHPTPAPDPDDSPDLSVSTPLPGVIEVKFSGKGQRGHAKPKGVTAMELCTKVTDSQTPPSDWSELDHSDLATRSPLRKVFSGHERGKWLHLAGRWINTRGVKGPWSEILSVIIP